MLMYSTFSSFSFLFFFSKTAQLRFIEETNSKDNVPLSLELPLKTIKVPAAAQISWIAAISSILSN